MRPGICIVFCLLLCAPFARAQGAVEGPLPQLAGASSQANTSAPPPPQGMLLNNNAIMKMTAAGLDEGIILQTVRSQPGDYRTGPDDLIALKSAGVSQTVISAMLARNSGLQQRAAPAPVGGG